MTYPDGWELQPDKCRCDLDFIEWIKKQHTPYSIFHMGTGLHHQVGLSLYQEHDVMGMTYSPSEMNVYTGLCENPMVDFGYKVIFGDIHLLNFKFIPKFDIVTLFHLGEIYNPRPATIPPESIIMNFAEINPYGRILAYKDSAARIIPLFDEALELVEEFKSLRIYKPK